MKKWLYILIGLLGPISAAQAESRTLGDEYTAFKNYLSNRYGFSYNLTYSALLQRTSPSGDANAFQSYLAPSITWTTFDNEYGTGVLNASY